MESGASQRTGQRQRELWGARAGDWAEIQEIQVRPLYVAALDAVGAGSGKRLLDVGCGSGAALAMAAERGAEVAGFDATPELLAIARERLPDADLREGDIEELPWEDDSFDAITGFNSFQFAGDPTRALSEAKRVARPGAPVAMATWGRPEACEAAGYLKTVGSLMPPPPPGAEGPFSLSEPGALEKVAAAAGLDAQGETDVDVDFAYPDLDMALRGLLSSGPVVAAMNHAGEDAVRDAVAGFVADYTDDEGRVRMRNVFRYVVASA
jgi:SAM-dependent methyltransferase